MLDGIPFHEDGAVDGPQHHDGHGDGGFRSDALLLRQD